MSYLSAVQSRQLKTNLQLAIQRLRLVAKKKTERAHRARKQIANYMRQDKLDRARIYAEHTIREDYFVEAMEMVELYCDTLLTHFGLVQQNPSLLGPKDCLLDSRLTESVVGLRWVAPLMQSAVKELPVIADLLTVRFGNYDHREVNRSLRAKLTVQSPTKPLVDSYLDEIAKSLNPIQSVSSSSALATSPEVSPVSSSSNSSSDSPITVFHPTKFKSKSSIITPNCPVGFDESIFPLVPNTSLSEENRDSNSDSLVNLQRRFNNLRKRQN